MPRGHILFSQEKDAKVIQGVLPLDIPLMGLAAFPAVWRPLPGRAKRAHGLTKTTVRDTRNWVAIDT